MREIKTTLLAMLFATSLSANSDANTLTELFSKGEAYGNIKYYYIQTDKDKSYTNEPSTSAYANSVGGQLGFKTANFRGLSAAVTFMTTNPFLISNDPAKVDTSIIAKDNGARGGDATKGFSVLGEAYIGFSYQGADIKYGRKVLKTPLMHAKEVRMIPSTFNGLYTTYRFDKANNVGFDYITEFKQRTSDTFINIIQHALGEDTRAVTGSDGGYMLMGNYNYTRDTLQFNLYECYAKDFLNSLYLDTIYDTTLEGIRLHIAAQYINQRSVGNAEENLAQTGSITGAKKIRVNAFSALVSGTLSYGTLSVAYSKVLKDEQYHDSLVLPWDGTPLFTNMITSNDLFQSIYGNALKADSIYIGGSQGIKIAYKQRFDGIGLRGVSLTLAAMRTTNDKFQQGTQYDYNSVVAYKYDKVLSFAIKGIWVENSAVADKDGTVDQLKLLSQYRVIANYKF